MVITILFILLVFALLVYMSWRGPIPKIIWTYWHDKDHMPETVKKCIESWRRHCPDYDIRILGDSDTTHYRHSKDFIQRHADFVRLDLLRKHGGIWMDASVFLNRPIDWIHEDPSADFVGYEFKRNSRNNSFPFIENWFMAAPRGSRFIDDWHRDFFRYNDYDDVEEYMNAEMSDVDIRGIPNYKYHLPYVACQRCIQKRGPYKFNLRLADTDAFKHLEDVGWNYESAASNFCKGLYQDTTNLVKLTNPERTFIESGHTCDALKISASTKNVQER